MDEIRRIRRERGMKQKELADISGVDRATLNQIEMGRRSPTIATMEKLAATLGVEVADFFPKAEPSLFRVDSAARRQAAWGGPPGGTKVNPDMTWRPVPIPISEERIRGIMEGVERGDTTADEATRSLTDALAEAMRAATRGGGHAPAT